MVPTETDFIQIARKMFAAHIMEYTHFGSFQKSAKRFSCIGMCIAINILFAKMIDRWMAGIVFSDMAKWMMLIRHQMRFMFHVLVYYGQQGHDFIVYNRLGSNWALPLNGN